MKRGVGLYALFAFLVAGAHFASGPASRKAPSATTTEAAVERAPKDAGPAETTCEAFANPEQGKNSTGASDSDSGDEGQITALVERYLYGASQHSHLSPGALPKDIKLMIATVPDPVHTHLSLEFDRTLEAIQQAAQDERFTYDSSWLPWKSQSSPYSSLADQEAETREAARREICPGLILFRENMGAPRTEDWEKASRCSQRPTVDPYQCGMLVFVVSEKPTAGLNRIQWDNALWWIDRYASKDRPDKALRTFGPTFSGSLPTFVRALNDVGTEGHSFTSVLLYSGQIRGCASWKWMKSQLDPPRPAPLLPVRIADFEENDAVQTDRFFQFLKDRGHHLSEVAVLSEDETAYGSLPDSSPPPSTSNTKPPDSKPDSKIDSNSEDASCQPYYPSSDRPVHLYYPRDISAVRSAYQEQSIFSSGSTTDSSSGQRTVLHPESSPSAHSNTDTIEPFSGPNMALTQEAQLYGIVDTIKTHGIRYVLLRSTNTLDYLFLARFLHRAYPTAYLVTIGTDILFGREIDSTEFRGVVSLSSFPLLPRGQDWTRLTEDIPKHAHRVFGNYAMEGDYIATRFLITDPEASEGERQPFTHDATNKKDLPDYAAPFWLRSPGDGKPSRPSTWLGVIGRDGYWPLAVLNDGPPHIFSNEALIAPHGNQQQSGAAEQVPRQPLTLGSDWKFCCALAALLFFMHFFACHYGWSSQDFGMFVQFAPARGNRGPALIALGWSTICSLLLILFLTSFRIFAWLGGVDRVWTGFTGILAFAAAALALYGIYSWRVEDATEAAEPESNQNLETRAPESRNNFHRLPWIAMIVLLIGLTAIAGWRIFDYRGLDSGVTIAYRSVHLTSGVSPVVSVILMMAGYYWWFWHTLAGLALLGRGRPVLPEKIRVPKGLAMVSDEIAMTIETAAMPFPSAIGSNRLLYLIPLLLVVLQALVLLRPWFEGADLLLHSLENSAFIWTLHVLFWLALFLLLMECAQFLLTWFSLNRLLQALNRLPLRRTFAALQGLSMQSLWRLSGTTSRSRFKVFSYQMESLMHLRNELDSFGARDGGSDALRSSIHAAWAQGWRFVQKRCEEQDVAMINNSEAHKIRTRLSTCTEDILSDLLAQEWVQERTSLDLRDVSQEGENAENMALSEKATVRFAEEFVCMVYVGYLQNILARMRTMVLSMAGLFASIALTVAFYPYTPRPTIALSLMLLLLAIGAVVGTVYAGLDRDSTLSHITNTKPGALGAHFWLRILSFVGVPALGLIVAQFPEITDFVFSWITPSLGAMK